MTDATASRVGSVHRRTGSVAVACVFVCISTMSGAADASADSAAACGQGHSRVVVLRGSAVSCDFAVHPSYVTTIDVREPISYVEYSKGDDFEIQGAAPNRISVRPTALATPDSTANLNIHAANTLFSIRLFIARDPADAVRQVEIYRGVRPVTRADHPVPALTGLLTLAPVAPGPVDRMRRPRGSRGSIDRTAGPSRSDDTRRENAAPAIDRTAGPSRSDDTRRENAAPEPSRERSPAAAAGQPAADRLPWPLEVHALVGVVLERKDVAIPLAGASLRWDVFARPAFTIDATLTVAAMNRMWSIGGGEPGQAPFRGDGPGSMDPANAQSTRLRGGYAALARFEAGARTYLLGRRVWAPALRFAAGWQGRVLWSRQRDYASNGTENIPPVREAEWVGTLGISLDRIFASWSLGLDASVTRGMIGNGEVTFQSIEAGVQLRWY